MLCMSPCQSTGPTRKSALPAFELSIAMLPEETSRNVSSIQGNDDFSGGASGGALRLRPCFHLVPSNLLEINPSSNTWAKGRQKRQEEGTLHPLGPVCRQRRHHDQFPPWLSCESSNCCAKTEVIVLPCAVLFPTSPFQNLYWADVAVVWIALSFVN